MRTMLMTLCLALVFAATAVAVGPIINVDIQVSPATIILKAPCTWITIHADIKCSVVDADSVKINGVDVAVVKADARGDLVAKVPFDAVAPSLSPPEALIVLTGATKDGSVFSGSATVAVK